MLSHGARNVHGCATTGLTLTVMDLNPLTSKNSRLTSLSIGEEGGTDRSLETCP